MVISIDQALQGKDVLMIYQSNRRRSFPAWWPHKGLLAPENLAKAGFYAVGKKKDDDTVRCFCCYKELANWEENDDPWKEHLDHSKDCLFAKTGKAEGEISIEQLFLLLCARDTNRLKKLRQTTLTIAVSSKVVPCVDNLQPSE